LEIKLANRNYVYDEITEVRVIIQFQNVLSSHTLDTQKGT